MFRGNAGTLFRPSPRRKKLDSPVSERHCNAISVRLFNVVEIAAPLPYSGAISGSIRRSASPVSPVSALPVKESMLPSPCAAGSLAPLPSCRPLCRLPLPVWLRSPACAASVPAAVYPAAVQLLFACQRAGSLCRCLSGCRSSGGRPRVWLFGSGRSCPLPPACPPLRVYSRG